MATQLTPAAISRAGVSAALAVVDATGNYWNNTGKEFMALTYSAGANITVTFAFGITVDGVSVGGKAVAVSAGTTVYVGPFPTGTYNDANGQVQVTYSGGTVANLSGKVFRLTPEN